MAVVVDRTKCIGCGSCVLLCPVEAMEVSDTFVVTIDADLCTDCLTCLNCCSNDALEEA